MLYISLRAIYHSGSDNLVDEMINRAVEPAESQPFITPPTAIITCPSKLVSLVFFWLSGIVNINLSSLVNYGLFIPRSLGGTVTAA